MGLKRNQVVNSEEIQSQDCQKHTWIMSATEGAGGP